MKKLYSLFLATLLSFTAYSQHLVIGVQGGVQFNSLPSGASTQEFRRYGPSKSSPIDFFYNPKSKPVSIVGVKVGLDMKKIAAGLGCNFSKINYNMQMDPTGIWLLHITSSVINPYAYLRVKKNLVRSYIYLGITAGYINIGKNKPEITYKNPKGTIMLPTYSSPAQHGFAGGLQAGYHFHIVKGLGIFGEAGAIYNTSTALLPFYDLSGRHLGDYGGKSYLSFPVTAGVDYRF